MAGEYQNQVRGWPEENRTRSQPHAERAAGRSPGLHPATAGSSTRDPARPIRRRRSNTPNDIEAAPDVCLFGRAPNYRRLQSHPSIAARCGITIQSRRRPWRQSRNAWSRHRAAPGQPLPRAPRLLSWPDATSLLPLPCLHDEHIAARLTWRARPGSQSSRSRITKGCREVSESIGRAGHRHTSV